MVIYYPMFLRIDSPLVKQPTSQVNQTCSSTSTIINFLKKILITLGIIPKVAPLLNRDIKPLHSIDIPAGIKDELFENEEVEDAHEMEVDFIPISDEIDVSRVNSLLPNLTSSIHNLQNKIITLAQEIDSIVPAESLLTYLEYKGSDISDAMVGRELFEILISELNLISKDILSLNNEDLQLETLQSINDCNNELDTLREDLDGIIRAFYAK